MKTFILKPKQAHTLFLLIGILLLGSCINNNSNNKADSKIENSAFEKQLFVGSWKDTSKSALHFTLFKDGTARSDNMATLLYKNWKVEGDQIIFTIESVGNKTSSTDTAIYTIEKLSKEEMILKKGDYLFKYTKK